MNIIITILYFVSAVIFIYLTANSIYLFVMALSGRLITGRRFTIHADKKKIAILIPCYKEDMIIPDTASSAAIHDYPKNRFTVTVIADKLRPATISELRQIPVRVLEVDLDMKSKSLHAALETMLEPDEEIVMILDADNIMGPGCLEKVNAAFQNNCRAVQCHRTAKNKNTPVAWLDAISEEINVNLFRRGPALLGLSAAPIGSGMAFETALIREIFSSEEILRSPGEDREIDMQLMRRQIKMEFIDDALVYDEKVSSAGVFEKQRVRWLEAQMNHLRRFFHADMRSAPKTTLYYNKFFQNLLLPRILAIASFCLIAFFLVIQALFNIRILFPAWPFWAAIFLIYFLALFISIPIVFYSMGTLRALTRVPVLMFAMIRALLKMKKKRTEFIHTEKVFREEEKS